MYQHDIAMLACMAMCLPNHQWPVVISLIIKNTPISIMKYTGRLLADWCRASLMVVT